MDKLRVEDGGKSGPVGEDVDGGVDIRRARANIYFGPQVELLKRFTLLALKIKGVSVSGLIVTCCAACIDTLEKEVPTLRRFKLNGRNVEL